MFPGNATPQSWSAAKAAQVPIVEVAEFGAAYPQPLANLAWEDGIYITRDGLNLYAYYEPADLFSFIDAGLGPDKLYEYERGDLIGQDFGNPIVGETTAWVHADIALAQRSSTSQPFTCWVLTGLAGKYYNRGGAVGILNPENPTVFDYFAYTDDSSGVGRIKLLRNTPLNPTTLGADLPANVSASAYTQDNPHLERVDPADPNHLVLLFESKNPPTSPTGVNAIWYSSSTDGTTWSTATLVSSVDSAASEDQPHLYFDGTLWWLYFTSVNPADHKPAIYRASQTIAGNWDSWGARQLVISAGTTAGVGEPTLTATGDLSFVAITENSQGTATDTFDADPWFVPHQ